MPSLVADVVQPGTLAALRQPTLSFDGVVLRPWQLADQPAVVAAYSDPDIQRWHCRSMDDSEAAGWLAAWPERWSTESRAGWAVTLDGAVAGQIGLRTLNFVDGEAEISYWTLPSYRGRRIAPRALAAMSSWAFGSLGLHRLVVRHSMDNPASCKVAVAAGFPAEGVQRGALLHADGWHDMHLHARLDTDS
ncbi:GNAT family N-acetyltransferase [Dactylosporangium matsuzakiense]|uniref:Acetyltransferase n=1 Tax=Dactylosporangium matsuzakiense TaxID=53360 RepID=A0A9W6NJA2_9ACTN|nr:GNAT family N-acetyltransferase [Dactylosporangium matsuzakiense]GLK99053.1 acetyltransferase [Dactylosporangium matsuzakiense]